MCWRSASEHDLSLRTVSRPEHTSSKRARSLVEVLRDLFRPRPPQVEQPEVVPFPAESAAHADREVDREGSKAA
jgi:hypothetical protein